MNKFGKTTDTTYLNLDQAEARGFLHRDYMAHCFRWSHVVKELYTRQNYKTARILDIGCGRLIPMATMLHSSRLAPEVYVGVDYGPIDMNAPGVATTVNSQAFNCELLPRTDASKLEFEDGEDYNWIVSFEMLEHIEPKMMLDTLRVIHTAAAKDARIFISTPNYNGKAAANHVNEMTAEALLHCFRNQGLYVKNAWGTFASIKDYKHLLNGAEEALFERLRGYYDVNVLACIFAPRFPLQSRNILWELTVNPAADLWGEGLRIPRPAEINRPWSSSEKWEELAVTGGPQ